MTHEIAAHIGKLPDGVPAAWWTSDHPDNLDGYRKFKIDDEEWRQKFRAVATEANADVETARISEWGARTHLSGLLPNDRRNIADGWRLDPKRGVIVPRRKTKVDRESAANTAFGAIAKVPNVLTYVTGMPTELWLPGRIYFPDVRMLTGADDMIVAFLGGDPDRLERPRREFVVDPDYWTRHPLSTFHLIREAQS